MLWHLTVWFDMMPSRYPSKEPVLSEIFAQGDRHCCLKDCDKQHLHTTVHVSIDLWKISPGHTEVGLTSKLLLYVLPRVHKNKSRQLHTMGSATAEFEVRHRWRTTTLFSGRYALNAEHVHARSLQKLHLFDWHFRLGLHFACTCSSKYSVHRWVQRSRINVFPFLVQTDVGSDDELRILPWQHS